MFDTGWYGGGAAFNVYGIPQVGQNQLSYSGLWIVNINSAVLLTAGWLDIPTGNWWFSFGNSTNYVGYWPKDIFPKGLEVADQMLYGGYVTCPESERCPPMGNGDLPSSGTACDVKKVTFVDKDTKIWGLLEQLRDPNVNNPSCYDVGNYNRVGINTFEFTYGGPGCP